MMLPISRISELVPESSIPARLEDKLHSRAQIMLFVAGTDALIHSLPVLFVHDLVYDAVFSSLPDTVVCI